MKKSIVFFNIILFLIINNVYSLDVKSTGRITEVTVFPGKAGLTKTIVRHLAKGEHRIIFSKLPYSISDNSLRANAIGNSGIVLIGAEVKPIFKKIKNSSLIEKLQNSIKQIKLKIKLLNKEKAVVNKELSFLNSIKISTIHDINKKIKIRNITVTDWSKLYSFIFTKIHNKTKKLYNIDNEIEKLYKKKKELNREYYSIYQGTERRYKNAVVRLKVNSPGRCVVSINYQQYGASWYPSYDLRLSKDKKTVALTYFGTVYQKSGEDWKNIKLNLSTARTLRWNRMPNLYPWYLYLYSYRRPYRRRSFGSGLYSKKKEYSKMDQESDDMKQKPQIAKRQTASVKKGSTAVTFLVPGSSTVKSDGSKIKKVLKEINLPVSFVYKAIPQSSQEVFIEGNIKNNTDLFFLPGMAQIFKEKNYIGNTKINNLTPNATIKSFFGTDSTIITKKELLIKKLDPGSDNEWNYKYKLTVKNNKSKKVSVKLFDTLPVSKNTDIEVKIKKMTLKPNSKNEKGIYRWDLKLLPGQKKVITYHIKIEYPSKKIIRGLK